MPTAGPWEQKKCIFPVVLLLAGDFGPRLFTVQNEVYLQSLWDIGMGKHEVTSHTLIHALAFQYPVQWRYEQAMTTTNQGISLISFLRK